MSDSHSNRDMSKDKDSKHANQNQGHDRDNQNRDVKSSNDQSNRQGSETRQFGNKDANRH